MPIGASTAPLAAMNPKPVKRAAAAIHHYAGNDSDEDTHLLVPAAADNDDDDPAGKNDAVLLTSMRTRLAQAAATLPCFGLGAWWLTGGSAAHAAAAPAAETAGTASAAALVEAPFKSMLGPKAVWWLESCVGIGAVKMGLPGLAAQLCFLAPPVKASFCRSTFPQRNRCVAQP